MKPRIVEIYPGYWIADNGNIASTRRGTPVKLKPWLTGEKRKQYLTVWIHFDNQPRKAIRIHRLVAEAFIPNPHGYNVVNHIDGNELNNHYTNLEWTTHALNSQHENSADRKLLPFQVEQIRKLLANTDRSYRDIGDEFGVERSTIYSIAHRKTWRNVS